jgi:hypothetical protein
MRDDDVRADRAPRRCVLAGANIRACEQAAARVELHSK